MAAGKRVEPWLRKRILAIVEQGDLLYGEIAQLYEITERTITRIVRQDRRAKKSVANQLRRD